MGRGRDISAAVWTVFLRKKTFGFNYLFPQSLVFTHVKNIISCFFASFLLGALVDASIPT